MDQLRKRLWPGWELSRYDVKTLSDNQATATGIKSGGNGLFGILEARDRSIWFGSMNGVYHYDGSNVNDFKGNIPSFGNYTNPF